MSLAELNNSEWRCGFLFMTILLQFLLVIYLSSQSTGNICDSCPKPAAPEPRWHLRSHPFLSQQCFVYSNLTARFNCPEHGSYQHYTSDRILSCATEFWKRIRDPAEIDPWEDPQQNNSDYVSVSKRPFVNWLIIGDSHYRYIFDVLVKRIAGPSLKYRIASFKENKWEASKMMIKDKLHNLHEAYHTVIRLDKPLKVTFRWDPYLQVLPKLIQEDWKVGNATTPDFVFFGTAFHFMRDARNIYLEKGQLESTVNYTKHMEDLHPILKNFSATTKTIYKLTDHIRGNYQVYSDSNVDYFNYVAKNIFEDTDIIVMDSTGPLSNMYFDECLRASKNTVHGEWKCEDVMHI
ncbi:hypothetical protein SK128_027477, partial [Halocaridina rubra]